MLSYFGWLNRIHTFKVKISNIFTMQLYLIYEIPLMKYMIITDAYALSKNGTYRERWCVPLSKYSTSIFIILISCARMEPSLNLSAINIALQNIQLHRTDVQHRNFCLLSHSPITSPIFSLFNITEVNVHRDLFFIT